MLGCMKRMSFIKHIFNKDSVEKLNFSDIDNLKENKTKEFLNLDYEEIPQKFPNFNGLAQHISGFLNTSGGVIIFGLSEKKVKGHNLPGDFTWTKITKEMVENNLFQLIDPWNEEIRIIPIMNPENLAERIFTIFVPKSKNPPHMANKRYYIRLNFRTAPIGHDHVKRLFTQTYLQKQDLIGKVYGPLFNELSEFYKYKIIGTLPQNKLFSIINDNRYLILYLDFQLYENLDFFYDDLVDWNKKVTEIPFHVRNLINNFAMNFIKKELFRRHEVSGVKLEIKAESTHQYPSIDQSILNDEDPVVLWKRQNPHKEIIYTKMHIDAKDETEKKDFNDVTLSEEERIEFTKQLLKQVAQDKKIQNLRDEFKRIHEDAESIVQLLEDRL